MLAENVSYSCNTLIVLCSFTKLKMDSVQLCWEGGRRNGSTLKLFFFSGIPTALVFVWVMTRIYLEDTG